jgi:hypothetical protein
MRKPNRERISMFLPSRLIVRADRIAYDVRMKRGSACPRTEVVAHLIRTCNREDVIRELTENLAEDAAEDA